MKIDNPEKRGIIKNAMQLSVAIFQMCFDFPLTPPPTLPRAKKTIFLIRNFMYIFLSLYL